MRNFFAKYLTLNTAIVIATTGLALVLAAHLLVLEYTYPQADDLCFFADVRNGLFSAMDFYYMQHGGGPTFRLLCFCSAILPFNFEWLEPVRLLPCPIVAELCFVFYCRFKTFTDSLPVESVSANLRTGLALTTLFLVTNFTTLEGFFWYNGSAFYIFSLLPCVIVLEFGITLLGNASLSRLKTFLIEVALVFVGLTHELYSIGLMLFFGSVTFVLLKRKMTLMDSRLQACA